MGVTKVSGETPPAKIVVVDRVLKLLESSVLPPGNPITWQRIINVTLRLPYNNIAQENS